MLIDTDNKWVVARREVDGGEIGEWKLEETNFQLQNKWVITMNVQYKKYSQLCMVTYYN